MGENAKHRSAFKWLQNEPAKRASLGHDAGELEDCGKAGKRSRMPIIELSVGETWLVPFGDDSYSMVQRWVSVS